jgi:GTP cyclohydrolase I
MEKKEFSLEQKQVIEDAIFNLLKSFGVDLNREGLRETPHRAMKYWTELLEGELYTNDEIADMFNKVFEDVQSSELVIEKDIEIFSHCEHHLALMYDMRVHIAYIPNGKVIGLSKMARIAEMVGKRLQLQERIGTDINYIMRKVLGTEDVAVVIEGKHGCMTARGVKARSAITRTACLEGRFMTNPNLRAEMYSLLK